MSKRMGRGRGISQVSRIDLLKAKHQVRYPWDTWFGEVEQWKTVVLQKGIHFVCKVLGMRSNVLQAAERYGIRVSIQTTDDTISISKGV